MTESLKTGKFSMKIVAKRSGLSPFVIRIWENRYQVVNPMRSASNRRLYSEEDIAKLELLKLLTDRGYSIGQIAYFTINELSNLLVEFDKKDKGFFQEKHDIPDLENYMEEAIASIKQFNSYAFKELLIKLRIKNGPLHFIDKILVPLLIHIGELWESGEIRISHEHLASSVIRSVIGEIYEEYRVSDSTRSLVATTPRGQLHEFSALNASIVASFDGWKATYIGPNLPNDEIVFAAQQNQANILLLSIIYPLDDLQLIKDLQYIASYLPKKCIMIVYGQSLDFYAKTIDEIGAIKISTATELKNFLKKI